MQTQIRCGNISVYQSNALTEFRERDAEIGREHRFAHTTLSGDDRYYPRHFNLKELSRLDLKNNIPARIDTLLNPPKFLGFNLENGCGEARRKIHARD